MSTFVNFLFGLSTNQVQSNVRPSGIAGLAKLWDDLLAVLARQVLRAEARIALQPLKARGAVDAFAVFTGVYLHLALLATVAELTLASKPRQKIIAAAAVSKDARGREAGVCRLLARRPRPLGGADAAGEVKQVLARAPVLTVVWGAHAGPPAAVARRWPTVHPGEELLLRPGKVQFSIMVKWQQQAANLHWAQAARERGSDVRTPQENVCPFLEEI